MSLLSPMQIYRRMFGTANDGLACYWYFGTMSIAIDGQPVIPVIQAQTAMVYKTTTLSEHSFKMDWWEIGIMVDPTTGDIAESWTNPMTGAVIRSPRSFEEGPATFTVTEHERNLTIDLVQAHATVIGVEVEISEARGRVFLQQSERKYRGFPRQDGTFPEPGEPGSVLARTQLNVWADSTELQSAEAPFSSGSYEFELDVPSWMGFGDLRGICLTRGIMSKTPMNRALNPLAWQRLRATFPARFDGDELRPAWF